MNKELFERYYAKIVDRALIDTNFKRKLLANPLDVFKEYDFDIPQGMDVKIHENTDKVIHCVLPSKKSEKPVERKHWIAEMFDDLYRLTFLDSKHDKTWAEIQEEDKKIFHSRA